MLLSFYLSIPFFLCWKASQKILRVHLSKPVIKYLIIEQIMRLVLKQEQNLMNDFKNQVANVKKDDVILEVDL